MILDKIFNELKEILPEENKYLEVDTKSGNVKIKNESMRNNIIEDYLPIPIFIRAKDYKIDVEKISDDIHNIDIFCSRPKDGAVEIAFETSDEIFYSAGAGENQIIEIPRDLKHDPAMSLSNGFLFLGNNFSIIKDCSVEHLAVTWRRSENRIVFREELNKNNHNMKMRFYIVKGSKEFAHNLANQINTWPKYYVKQENQKVELEKILPIK